MILIKDGRVIDPQTGLDETLDLVIQDGVIKEIGKFQESDSYEKVIHAKGNVVAPVWSTFMCILGIRDLLTRKMWRQGPGPLRLVDIQLSSAWPIPGRL